MNDLHEFKCKENRSHTGENAKELGLQKPSTFIRAQQPKN